MGYHGMRVGGLDGSLYTVFDPPWWKLHLWVWWFYRTRVEPLLVRVWIHRNTYCGRGNKTHTFDTGVIELRVGNEAFRVRVYRDRETWLVWTPAPPAPPLVSKLDVRPDDALPPNNDVHPMERGL